MKMGVDIHSENYPSMGNSFFADLQLIRESKALTLDDIKDKTMIPKEILMGFESSGLSEHPRFNTVYLHSLAKGYADVLGISRSEVRKAVDETAAGHYKGRLAGLYLDYEIAEDTPAPVVEEVPLEPSMEESSSSIEISAEKPLKETPSIPVKEAASPTAAFSKRTASKKSKRRGKYSGGKKSKNGILLAAGILTVVVSLASLLWFSWRGESASNSDSSLNANGELAPELLMTRADSLENGLIVIEPEPVRWVIPDTMNLSIVAATEIIQAMEITRDQSEDHPRWVELGDTVKVVASEKFSLYKGIQGIELYLNGRNVPKDLGQVTRYRVDIERDKVQAYFDSLDAVTQ